MPVPGVVGLRVTAVEVRTIIQHTAVAWTEKQLPVGGRKQSPGYEISQVQF